jgi:hypothetical protein
MMHNLLHGDHRPILPEYQYRNCAIWPVHLPKILSCGFAGSSASLIGESPNVPSTFQKRIRFQFVVGTHPTSVTTTTTTTTSMYRGGDDKSRGGIIIIIIVVVVFGGLDVPTTTTSCRSRNMFFRSCMSSCCIFHTNGRLGIFIQLDHL